MKLSPVEATDPSLLNCSKFRVWGGDGDGDDSSGGGDSGGGEQSGSGDGSANSGAGDGDSGTAGGEQTPDLQAQLDEERAARIQLQRERDEAAERAADAANASADEADRVASERDSYKQKYEKLKELMSTSYLDNAIRGQTKFDFHDTEAVRAFLDQSKIRLDLDTGQIDGLDEQLRKIAKDKPYLVKQPENAGGGDGFTPPPGPNTGTGSHPYGGSARQSVTDKQKLGQKYKIPGYGSMAAGRPV